jgi:N-acylglucosamine-6-phosphate 2-epimerase
VNLETLEYGLIVSCQAHNDHPLRDPLMISALAVCAERGGAIGIRADGAANVRAVREKVSLPVVGIRKVMRAGERSFITPTLEHAREVVEAGADVVALEAARENRADDEVSVLIRRVREELGVPVMADVSTFGEGLRAWEAGAEYVATTLSGYTPQSPRREGPDLDLVAGLANAGIRVVAEGHVRTPKQVRMLFDSGAYAVVVGTAITDPISITSRFAQAAPGTVSR